VWLALGEAPGSYTLVGGAIVLSTLALNTVWALRQRRVKRLEQPQTA
jgi:drug/metabolite transporter (DMT)-like permease